MPSHAHAELLAGARPGLHVCQFHDGSDSLAESIALFAGEGLRQRDAVILVITPEHRETLLARLRSAHLDVEMALASGQLALLDAASLLAEFMRDGKPDRELFELAIGPQLETAAARRCGRLRIYGEMVSVLWEAGQPEAAIELEECWNALARSRPFALLCGYRVDGLEASGYRSPLHEIGRTHAQVLATAEDDRLCQAVDAASRDVLGISFSLILSCSGREQVLGEHRLPSGRRTLLWLHRNMPVTSHHILTRACAYMRGDRPLPH